MNKTALIIHGHFYQPPREDSSTGLVPDQSSAKPYTNWNEAVYSTCYKPNAFSRYLSYDGKVEAIYNNYSTISLNFGPTLLNWIDEAHPDFIQKLREADRESIAKYGHSNFIAQTYNHSILPLDSRRNKRLEIRWALEDYKARFGHESEGFWCAECAIDKETVDELADAGIKFVILSPWQAESINNEKLNGKPAPYDRAFILEGNEKTISAFFYNPDYASGISFGHLLRNADTLYKNLVAFRQKNNYPAMLSWATDGEIYGHHEAFGDMALAALIKKVNEGDDFYFTNYAAFLADNPPVDTAQLYLGEDGHGSSWSCSHGVKRWYTDCGCHTGGEESWNQKWRTPLRTAFMNLEEKARTLYTEKIRDIFGENTDCEEILLNYGKVLANRLSVSEYIRSVRPENGKSLSDEDISAVAVLLDSMKNVLFSFTSCGWFFNDVSGIEPSQNISYAVYAATNLQRLTNINILNALLRDLREAKSNVVSSGNGETIAKTYVNVIPAPARACAFFTINRKLADESDFTDRFGFFRLDEINGDVVSLTNLRTLENSKFRCILQDENNTFALKIKNLKTGFSYLYDKSQVPLNILRTISLWVEKKLSKLIPEKSVNEIYENISNYIALADADKYGTDESIFSENINLCLHALKFKNSLPKGVWEEEMLRLQNISRCVRISCNQDNIKQLTDIYDRYLKLYSDAFIDGKINDQMSLRMLQILSIARSEDYKVDISELQNTVAPYIYGKTNLKESTVQRLKEDLNFRYL